MKIEHIKKKYGKKVILEDINLSVEKGMCVGILGSNGSGKSTLFSILAGVIKGDNGNFNYHGVDLFKERTRRSEVLGYVPQNTPLIEELTALDNLKLWYSKENMDRELSNGVLGMLGINEFLKVPVCKMSGGMKKRLAIGCAVAHKPEILFLDEPSAALDLVCKEQILKYLINFKSAGGIIVLATHDIQELAVCDRMYILKNGVLEPYYYDGDVNKLAGSL